jgi:hypothetical protein
VHLVAWIRIMTFAVQSRNMWPSLRQKRHTFASGIQYRPPASLSSTMKVTGFGNTLFVFDDVTSGAIAVDSAGEREGDEV